MIQATATNFDVCDRCGYKRPPLASNAVREKLTAENSGTDPIALMTAKQLRFSLFALNCVPVAAGLLVIGMSEVALLVVLVADVSHAVGDALFLCFATVLGALTLSLSLLAWARLPGTGAWHAGWGMPRLDRLTRCFLGAVLVLPPMVIFCLMVGETLAYVWLSRSVVFLPDWLRSNGAMTVWFLLALLGSGRLTLHAATTFGGGWNRRSWQSLCLCITATTLLGTFGLGYIQFVDRTSPAALASMPAVLLQLVMLIGVPSLAADRIREQLRELAETDRKPNPSRVVAES